MFQPFFGCQKLIYTQLSRLQSMFPLAKDVPFFKGCSLLQRMLPFAKDVPFFKGIPLLNCFGLDPFLKGFPFTKGWENTFTCCRVLPSFALLLLWSSVSSPRLLWSSQWSAHTCCSFCCSLQQWACIFLPSLWSHTSSSSLGFWLKFLWSSAMVACQDHPVQ